MRLLLVLSILLMIVVPVESAPNSSPIIIGSIDAGGFSNETFTWDYSSYVVDPDGDRIYASCNDKNITWDGLTAIIHYTKPGDYFVNITFTDSHGASVTRKARIRIVEAEGWKYTKVLWTEPILKDGEPETDFKETEEAVYNLNADAITYIMSYFGYENLENFLNETKLEVWCVLDPVGNEPFGNDFEAWAEYFANISLKYPNLKAFTIDDLHPYQPPFFTPGYIKRIMQAKNRINPNLRFIPTLYFDSGDELKFFRNRYKEVFTDGTFMWYWASYWGTPDLKELENYVKEAKELVNVPVIVGIYPIARNKFYNTTFLKEMLETAMQLDGIALFMLPLWAYDVNHLYNRTIFKQLQNDDKDFDYKLGLPPGTWWTMKGWYQAIYTTLDGCRGNVTISFKMRDTQPDVEENRSYYFKQLLVNNNVIMEGDVAEDGVETAEIRESIPCADNLNISIRLFGKKEALGCGIDVYVGDIKIFVDGNEVGCKWKFKSGIEDIEKYVDVYEAVKEVLSGNHSVENSVKILKPKNGIYIMDRYLLPSKYTIILGKITIEAKLFGNMNKVEFYIDDELKATDYESPYSLQWDEAAFGQHEIKIIAYGGETKAEDREKIWIFNV